MGSPGGCEKPQRIVTGEADGARRLSSTCTCGSSTKNVITVLSHSHVPHGDMVSGTELEDPIT